MFTARVPSFGLVDWTAGQVDAYAEELRRTHLPRRNLAAVLLRRQVEVECAQCAEVWPCPAAWWAERYQASVARTLAAASSRLS